MKPLDRLLQRWRISKAAPWVRQDDRLLDVGCFDLSLLRVVEPRIQRGVGIDPLAMPSRDGRLEMVRGHLPAHGHFEADSFDCITLLAVLEHIPDPESLARECDRLLAPGGRVVLTVPRPAVDRILAVLSTLRLIEGLSLEQHYGYEVARTATIFESAGFKLLQRRPFQLGLNCLFVFEKPGAPAAQARPAEARVA